MHVSPLACAGVRCQETWGDAEGAGMNRGLRLIKEGYVFQLRTCCLLPPLLVRSAEFAWSNPMSTVLSLGFLDKTKA